MAQSNAGTILTYHVVPRFDMAAKNGPLALGTVVADLSKLVPLNRGFRKEVPETLLYDPVTQSDFKSTLATVRRLNASGWLSFLGGPANASAAAKISASSELENGVECDAVTTTYFDDPDGSAYIKSCLDVKPIRDRLETSAAARGHAVDLYVVTGLKVAHNLRYNLVKKKENSGELEASAKDPNTQVGGGVGVGGAQEKRKKVEFTVNDIVIGYRVNKYRCVRKWFKKDWSKKDEGQLEGNMQASGGGEDDEEGQMVTQFEALVDGDEAAARAAAQGAAQGAAQKAAQAAAQAATAAQAAAEAAAEAAAQAATAGATECWVGVRETEESSAC